MFGFFSNKSSPQQQLPKPFSLPSPLPQWPKGQGFATGTINLGEIEVAMVNDFELVATCTVERGCVVTFYKPVCIPEGFFALGYYCQPGHEPQPPTAGYVLVARNVQQETETEKDLPPLKLPRYYKPIWTNGTIFVWKPIPPKGYRALGCVVTKYVGVVKEVTPDRDQVRCVRDDLTEECDSVMNRDVFRGSCIFVVVNPKPSGMFSKGVAVGTSLVISSFNESDLLDVRCLTNMNPNLEAMPNLKQVEALIHHYGPTVYFHPDEIYLPSSVPWFFNNGGLVLKNEDKFCLGLPADDDTMVKHGNLESAQFYVHVKPALSGTFTDIDMWIFYPFNGPQTFTFANLFNLNMEASKHVGGWNNFTLRVSNFNGQLWSVYFSEHTYGKWVHASNLDFIEGNKPTVYSSNRGHNTFPSAGRYIQGSKKLFGIGEKHDVDKSDMFLDASKKYQVISAEYLGSVVAEPDWLQYMQEWVPTVLHDERAKLAIISNLPFFIRPIVVKLFDIFPLEHYVRKKFTWLKEKDQRDERC